MRGLTQLASCVAPGLALLPLRVFLGITFLYGGVQKLNDPGFLHPGAATYIGSQLHGFATGTPGGFVLRALALPAPQLAGVGVALVEILVGVLVTAGLLTRIAALVGLGLNLLLFLSASWKTYPYFLGSDIVFVFAWLPFVLAGAQGQPAVDHALDRLLVARPRRGRDEPVRSRSSGGHVAPEALTRRAALGRALGMSGAAAVALAALATVTRGGYRGASTRSLSAGAGSHTATTPSSPLPVHHHRPHSAAPAGGVRLGPSRRLPAGQGATYRDPTDGQPDIVVRDASGRLSATSAICTHAGCPVEYQQGTLYCPCHGSVFNARTGAVEQGPAQTPLAQKHVVEQGGWIYALPS